VGKIVFFCYRYRLISFVEFQCQKSDLRKMSPPLTHNLHTQFPYLYRGHVKSIYESAMGSGFGCGDGWYPLIAELSQALTEYLAAHPELDVEVTQVKSKFGRLRFYIRGGDDAMRDMIRIACDRSEQIVEGDGDD
jgi:hypothetical protein